MTLQTHHYTGGRNNLVRDLVRETGAAANRVEAWGNSREGFTPYLVQTLPMGNGDDFTGGIAIGSTYRTLSGLRADVAQAYGQGLKVRQGRAW